VNVDSATWIDDGEKYGLVGLSVKLEGHIPLGPIAPNLWVLADTAFNIPPQWRAVYAVNLPYDARWESIPSWCIEFT
jgi:hypothetical protein